DVEYVAEPALPSPVQDGHCFFGIDRDAGMITVGSQVALDLRDGRERWRRRADMSEGRGAAVRMLRLHRGQLLLGVAHESEAPAVIALDASTGTELWRTRPDTGGGFRFYRLFDELLVLAGEQVTLVERS